ncbi:TIR domain-containing protein [Polychytrium aggregatum]|uniref:TIR domain-containing protein n=1 Tax=Polychytrium aggregatum TaxID=110093 RepID=UPI0022FE4295|nr:TIR domain-containing protein [Polychytrium aggregatum]KAI9207724.1 TIR domain-containing protein [Polychytrium aggregatum]
MTVNSDIVVSYCWSDKPVVKKLVQRLRDRDLSIGFEEYKIRHDGLLDQEAANSISNCKAFVCCLSPSYEKSKACMNELRFAADQHRPTLPVRLGHDRLGDEVHRAIASKTGHLLETDSDEDIQKAVDAIISIVGEIDSADPAAPSAGDAAADSQAAKSPSGPHGFERLAYDEANSRITVKNLSDQTILCRVSGFSGGSSAWFPINPNGEDSWGRKGWEAVEIRNRNDTIHFGTYLPPGVVMGLRDFEITEKNSPFIVEENPGVEGIAFRNDSSGSVECRVTKYSNAEGSDEIVTIEPNGQDRWNRSNWEVLVVIDSEGRRIGVAVSSGKLVQFQGIQ